jgi:hypothetical protein
MVRCVTSLVAENYGLGKVDDLLDVLLKIGPISLTDMSACEPSCGDV